MNAIRSIVIAAVLAAPVPVLAAAPVLKVSKSVIIHAAPGVVWEKIRNFDGLDTWHPAVAKDELVAGHNNQPGAERLLTLGDGGTIREKLLGFDERHHRFKYEILDGVLPVSHYTSTVGVKAAGKNRSKVTWSGSFKRKDTGPHPAANADDAAATNTMGSVYQAGLDHLKKIIEAK